MSRSATKRLQQLNADRGRGPAAPSPSFSPPTGDDQVVSGIAFAAATILVFILIAAGAAFFGGRAIEGDIDARAYYALQASGFHDIDVEVTGFDVALQGFHHESQSVDEAIGAVTGITGVRSVDASGVFVVEVDELIPQAVSGRSLTFRWVNGALSISGDVSSEDIFIYLESQPQTFVDADEEPLFHSVDVDDLTVLEDLAPVSGLSEEIDWIGGTMALLRSLALGLDEGSLVVNPSAKVIITSGEVETRQEKRDITDSAEEFTLALEGHGFSITPGIIVPDGEFTATAEEVVEVTATLTELIADKVVEFELNSAELTDEGKALLDEILLVLREVANVPVEIAGHADASGTPEHNLELSLRRAQAVLAYFVANGEDPARFVVGGYGDTQPIPGGTAEQNRRIEFIPQEG